MDEMRPKKDLHPRVKEGLSIFRKGGKFLKKLWSCVSRRVQQGNLVLSSELKMQIGHGGCKELSSYISITGFSSIILMKGCYPTQDFPHAAELLILCHGTII